MDHNIHNIKPGDAPASIAYECVNCGEHQLHKSDFSEECDAGPRVTV